MIKSTTTKAGFFIKNVSKSAVMNGVFHETEYTVSRGRVIDTMWITFNQTCWCFYKERKRYRFIYDQNW